MSNADDRLLWIDGRAVKAAGDAWFETFNPGTGQSICRVARAGDADLDDAVAAARRASGEWKRMSGVARGRILRALADTLRARQATCDMPAVLNPDAALERYRRGAQARRAFHDLEDDTIAFALAERIGRPVNELRTLADDCTSAESFVMRLVPEPTNGEELALDTAEQRLALLETAHGCPNA